MKHIYRLSGRLWNWKPLAAAFGLAFIGLASATVPLYQNYSVLQYTIPGNPPPAIDATAFDNENLFQVNVSVYTPWPQLYETRNTLYYTNNGTMIAGSPITTNGFFGINLSYGSGYRFDNYSPSTGLHKLAGTFYNPGTIRCDSVLDGNNVFSFAGFSFYLITSIGECRVAATNIIIPGTIDVSVDGWIQLTGQNVDLTGGVLTQETLLNTSGTAGTPNISSVGAVGTDTNADWNPFVDLTATTAVSSFPYYLSLTNTTAYFDIKNNAGASNVIIRAVFIQNDSPNAPANVYFDINPTLFGQGSVHVEWVGGYLDPASGGTQSSYLYLSDDYVLGASTNAAVFGGVPNNFSLITSPTPLLVGPTTPGFNDVFPNAYIPVPYSYMNAQLVSSSTSTNASGTNPSGALTNLPGRIEITASNELNLAYTTISGQNYLSLVAPNQFDGSPGASIASPFSDINIGVTNGFLTVSNLLLSAIPAWSGNIQAWSTRWLAVNPATGITNDFRVMIVGSKLLPTSMPWIQSLNLHGTNSVVINDVLNVFKSISIDAQRLTVATNVVGNGATSLDGELNWYGPATFNANSSSGSQNMPNLLWLTNNGAFRAANNANFGGSNPQVLSVTPATSAVPASGKLSETGTNVVKNDKVIIGSSQYTFVGVITNTAANQVRIAATFDGSLSNLIAAINHAAGAGTNYSTNTPANPQVSAGSLVSHAFTVTTLATNGAAGNSIATGFTPATTSTNLAWSGSTLTNGVNYVPAITNYSGFPFAAFINYSLVADQGTTIWTTNFVNSGSVSNGSGSFVLQSRTATLTNGSIVAGSDVTITSSNLLIGSHAIQAGRMLTLQSTNLLADTGVTNGNIWVVGSAGVGGLDSGFNVPLKPAMGDLLGTTVTNYAPATKTINNLWAGTNRGISVLGFSNNLALGRLILDAANAASVFTFKGNGASNALYVDYLEFRDAATNHSAANGYDFSWLKINTNMMIYYAQAVINGVSVAEAIDFASHYQGANGGRLRWVPAYAGYFSSTNLVYPAGVTNTVNAALAASKSIDSDGDGIANFYDPTPFFVPGLVNFTAAVTTNHPPQIRLQWATVPLATNSVFYRTNLTSGSWLPFTNFTRYYYGGSSNPAAGGTFLSPQPYGSPATNVWVFDVVTNMPHYYRVEVQPWVTYPY